MFLKIISYFISQLKSLNLKLNFRFSYKADFVDTNRRTGYIFDYIYCINKFAHPRMANLIYKARVEKINIIKLEMQSKMKQHELQLK